ncbi:MAG: winged helix-turn-helix transcriptional regulator [Pseudomonadota bacterium]|nr:winged helix-turn-helix transcriptional regulator [Pseudomonadota bacterium]
MPQSRNADNNLDNESEIVLELLNVVHENSDLTQRSMARELGIALGMANTYLKRCVRKGYIKVRQIPSNRYSYYLTPKGFKEKSRLTAEYLSSSFTFFRRAKDQCLESLGYAKVRGWHRVALVGVGDLAEIFALCAIEHSVDLVGILDSKTEKTMFTGLNIAPTIADLEPLDALIITDAVNPQETFDNLLESFPSDRILTLPVLGILRDAPSESEQTQ